MGRHKGAVFEFSKALHCRYIFQTERCLFALTYYAEYGFLEGPDCIFYSETCIPGDTTHRKSVDRVIAWNCNDSNSVRHYDVFALANDAETGFLESLDGIEVVDARNFWHG